MTRINFTSIIGAAGFVYTTVNKAYYSNLMPTGFPGVKGGLVSKKKFQELESEYEDMRYNLENLFSGAQVLGATRNNSSFAPASTFEPSGIWLWVGYKRYNALNNAYSELTSHLSQLIDLLSQYVTARDINHNGRWYYLSGVNNEDNISYLNSEAARKQYQQQINQLSQQIQQLQNQISQSNSNASRNVTD